MVRAMGIEPMSQAWEARILPLNYARVAVAQMVKPNHSPEAIKKVRIHAPGDGGLVAESTNIRLPLLHI